MRQILPSVAVIYPQDAVILGAPVSGSRVTESVLLKKLTELRRLADRPKRLGTQTLFSFEELFQLAEANVHFADGALYQQQCHRPV